MGMNNIYYRFVHLVEDEEYATLRASLRMNVMSNPGCEKVDFELASLAVSAINGCGMCLESHEKTLRKHEVSAQAVQSAARIAAVLHAVAVTLEQAEAAGLRPAHGCRQGICAGCTCTLLGGAVRDLRSGQAFAEPGQPIRICVSAPLGDVQLDL